MENGRFISDSGTQDNPGIAAWRPAAIQLSAVLAGLMLHSLWPTEIPLAAKLAWIAVPMFLGGAIAIIALSYREFAKAKTSVRPDRGACALIRTGPFRYSRNPLYVAVSLLIAGIAVWMNSLWVLVMLIPLFLVLSRAVIAREERYLEHKFGREYRDYRASVRRWL
jgi:protein-S-isoprenylcysteine O-methyltransferase Ste14